MAGVPRWNNESHEALLAILVDVILQGDRATLAYYKDTIMAGMEARGYNFSWEAVRYVRACSYPNPTPFCRESCYTHFLRAGP